jgi:predicted proteasome-type protease
MSSSVKWLSNQTYELFEQYSEGNFDRITLNRLVLEATEKAKEMEIAGREMSYADGYAEGYKRALEVMEWYIKNHISGMPQDHIVDTNKMI